MAKKTLLLANLIMLAQLVNCGSNNLPTFDPAIKTIDCTKDKTVADVCEIMLVIDPLTSMTYYNISSDLRQLKGHRARFDSNGELGTLSDEIIDHPIFIQTDGHFRPIITVNGQMPGPTIIAHENQRLKITVYNELKDVEGISIHWHGMHQRGTQEADGVAYITQQPILPYQQFTYDFYAYPAGTHWYHAHSGAQRTDGLYGAFIIRDTIPGNLYDIDLPEQHTLLLLDWQRESSIDLFHAIGSSLRYWKVNSSDEDMYIPYKPTFSSDKTEVGPMPFWSAIINDKGRHYNESGQTNIRPDSLNYFTVSQGNRYRFRLIGAQALYAFRFSIQDHKMTVVATDGIPITPIEDVDYVIINTGETYDVIVHANVNTEKRNFWIWAETLEDENFRNEIFHSPINKHRGEAILHYDGDDYNIDDNINEIRSCTSSSKCKAVNCPFKTYSISSTINCTNADEFESLPSHDIPESIYSPSKTIFFSFGFDGEATTSGSSLDGVNFRFPANPPLTEYADFQNSNDMCPNRGCDHDTELHCACTQVIDISDQMNGNVVELVLSNRAVDEANNLGTAHPIHLHGHYFYVVKIGYPDYTSDDVFEAANDDIECINSTNQKCPNNFITVHTQNDVIKQALRWRNMIRPLDLDIQNKKFARKDTVIVPYGGYTVIRFIVDNPGWWFLHCHIEIHQLEGMAAVVTELPNELPSGNDQMVCTPTTCEPCTTCESCTTCEPCATCEPCTTCEPCATCDPCTTCEPCTTRGSQSNLGASSVMMMMGMLVAFSIAIM